jgi:hypothetical protein
MRASTRPGNNSVNTLPKTREERLRRFLIGLLLAGVIFNIVSWGGAAGFIILQQSGISIDWGEAGSLPSIHLGGANVQQTIPPDATLPPTPVDITSVGQPSDSQKTSTPTATQPADDTSTSEPDMPLTAPTP